MIGLWEVYNVGSFPGFGMREITPLLSQSQHCPLSYHLFSNRCSVIIAGVGPESARQITRRTRLEIASWPGADFGLQRIASSISRNENGSVSPFQEKPLGKRWDIAAFGLCASFHHCGVAVGGGSTVGLHKIFAASTRTARETPFLSETIFPSHCRR